MFSNAFSHEKIENVNGTWTGTGTGTGTHIKANPIGKITANFGHCLKH